MAKKTKLFFTRFLVSLSRLKELAPQVDWDNIESCTILPEDVHDEIIKELAKDFDVVEFLRECSRNLKTSKVIENVVTLKRLNDE